jgi:DegV family protein with EDD domain
MARVAVVTDSTADIPAPLMESLDISMVPLSVNIDGESFDDRVTITPLEFMERLGQTREFPTTSQPSVGQFAAAYERLAQDHDAIISIHISSRLSGTCESALMARNALNRRLPIAVLDARSASMGIGYPVLRAATLARAGRSLAEIEVAVRQVIDDCHVFFLVDTLEYLRRGGRIGRAAEIVGSVLQLKPILRLEEGIVVPYSRTRTRVRAMASMVGLVRELPRIGDLSILSAAGTTDVDRLADMVADFYPRKQIIFTELSPVLAAHVGPGGLGIVVHEGAPIELERGNL